MTVGSNNIKVSSRDMKVFSFSEGFTIKFIELEYSYEDSDEVYIDYESVKKRIGVNTFIDYELTHEEEEAIVAYISQFLIENEIRNTL